MTRPEAFSSTSTSLAPMKAKLVGWMKPLAAAVTRRFESTSVGPAACASALYSMASTAPMAPAMAMLLSNVCRDIAHSFRKRRWQACGPFALMVFSGDSADESGPSSYLRRNRVTECASRTSFFRQNRWPVEVTYVRLSRIAEERDAQDSSNGAGWSYRRLRPDAGVAAQRCGTVGKT